MRSYLQKYRVTPPSSYAVTVLLTSTGLDLKALSDKLKTEYGIEIADAEREAPQTDLPNLEFNRWDYVDGDIEGQVDVDRHEGTELLVDIDPDDFAKRHPLGEGINAWRSEAVLTFSLIGIDPLIWATTLAKFIDALCSMPDVLCVGVPHGTYSKEEMLGRLSGYKKGLFPAKLLTYLAMLPSKKSKIVIAMVAETKNLGLKQIVFDHVPESVSILDIYEEAISWFVKEQPRIHKTPIFWTSENGTRFLVAYNEMRQLGPGWIYFDYIG